jgi:hypothetical protein
MKNKVDSDSLLSRSAFPTPHDMILAYRKVKAEIWWMKTVPSLRALAEYEANIDSKLIEARDGFKRIAHDPQNEILGPWLGEATADEMLRSLSKYPTTAQARHCLLRFAKAFSIHLGEEEQVNAGIWNFRARDLDRAGWRVRMRQSPAVNGEKVFDDLILLLSNFFYQKSRRTPKCDPVGLLFPTRPLGETEICLNNPAALVVGRKMYLSLFALRGQALPTSGGSGSGRHSKHNSPPHRFYEAEFPGQSVRIAITNYQTELNAWTGRVRKKPDLSLNRLIRLLELVDAFLRHHQRSDWHERPLYFCFPELSIPPEWIHQIAFFFSQAGVSLVAGVEYEFLGKKGPLRNSAYLFLRNRNLGYPATYVIRQPKTQAAPAEAQELWQEGNYTLSGPLPEELPVYVHGDFRFGVLICSELTDAQIHHHFRGYVDAIICLEWNKDVETFSALVEGAAQTIHAFIVQVNNRLYGDSRIRAPAKERFHRDIVRLNGGDHDYWVVGTLPIKELRDFQRKAHSDLSRSAPYKPLPSGYDSYKFERLHPQPEEDDESESPETDPKPKS